MKRSMIKFSLLVTASFAAVAASGCTGDADDAPGLQTSSDALRALRTGEVIGSIQFGESKTIAYRDYFRALTVDARAGDVLQLSVTAASTAGKPMLWINNTQSATTTNLAQNLNAAGARTATLRYTVPATGRYYLVMRDANLLSQNFSVTLAARPGAACDPDEQECDSGCNPDEQDCGGAAPGLPPSSSVPAWDPESCVGPDITQSQVGARFVPGAQTANLGTVTLSTWKRSCGPGGCTEWRASNERPLFRGQPGFSDPNELYPRTLQVTAYAQAPILVEASNADAAHMLLKAKTGTNTMTHNIDRPTTLHNQGPIAIGGGWEGQFKMTPQCLRFSVDFYKRDGQETTRYVYMGTGQR